MAWAAWAALYRKEMSDHIRSKRFLIVLGLILLTSCASIYGALTGLSDAVASDSSYIFLKLFTLSGSSIPSFTSFIALLGPFVGLSLGFDAINSERSGGTLNRLVAPAYLPRCSYKREIPGRRHNHLPHGLFHGTHRRFCGTFGHRGAAFCRGSGKGAGAAVFHLCVYRFWLALSILCSVLCRHAATSAMIVIALWIFFALFMTLVVSIVANALYTMGQTASAGQILDNYSCQMSLNRLSPLLPLQ